MSFQNIYSFSPTVTIIIIILLTTFIFLKTFKQSKEVTAVGSNAINVPTSELTEITMESKFYCCQYRVITTYHFLLFARKDSVANPPKIFLRKKATSSGISQSFLGLFVFFIHQF